MRPDSGFGTAAYLSARTPAQEPGEIEVPRWEDHRDADLFRLLVDTGLRLGEALALRIGKFTSGR